MNKEDIIRYIEDIAQSNHQCAMDNENNKNVFKYIFMFENQLDRIKEMLNESMED